MNEFLRSLSYLILCLFIKTESEFWIQSLFLWVTRFNFQQSTEDGNKYRDWNHIQWLKRHLVMKGNCRYLLAELRHDTLKHARTSVIAGNIFHLGWYWTLFLVRRRLADCWSTYCNACVDNKCLRYLYWEKFGFTTLSENVYRIFKKERKEMSYFYTGEHHFSVVQHYMVLKI